MCEVTQGPSFGLEHNCKVTINWFVVQNLTRETTPQESIRWTVNSILGDLQLRSEQFCHLQELNQCWFVKFSNSKANTLMRKLFICELLKTDVDWNGIFSVDPKGEWYICTRLVRKLHGKLRKKPRIGSKSLFLWRLWQFCDERCYELHFEWENDAMILLFDINLKTTSLQKLF